MIGNDNRASKLPGSTNTQISRWKPDRESRAVSPVVGVMLMLIVTVVIAAVVSGFAGGFTETPRQAPTAMFDVHIYAGEHIGPNQSFGFIVPDMTISEISGDAIPTKDLKITTTFSNPDETIFAGNLSSEIPVSGNDTYIDSGGNWPSFTSSQYTGVLILNNGQNLASCIRDSPNGNSCWYGDPSAVLTAGESLTTAALVCGNYDGYPADPVIHNNPGMDYMLGFNVADQENDGGFGPGSVVEVRIFHIPSGKILYDKLINVE